MRNHYRVPSRKNRLPSPSFEYQVCVRCSFRVLVARSALAVRVSRGGSLSQRLHHLCVERERKEEEESQQDLTQDPDTYSSTVLLIPW